LLGIPDAIRGTPNGVADAMSRATESGATPAFKSAFASALRSVEGSLSDLSTSTATL